MGKSRWTGIFGIAAVAAFIAALVVIDVVGQAPKDTDRGAQLAANIADDDWTTYVGQFLWGVASLCLLAFFTGVGARLRAVADPLGQYVLAAGVAVVAVTSLVVWADGGGALQTDKMGHALEPGAAEALSSMAYGFFSAATVLLAGVYIATGIAALRSGTLPTWFGWLSLLFGVIALVPVAGSLMLFLGLPIWTVIVSLLLMREVRPGEVSATAHTV
jgi:hypothetical protein